MAEKIYQSVTAIVHAGRPMPAGKTFKGDDTDKAVIQALAFGLIKPFTESTKQPPRRSKHSETQGDRG